jgi:hypothetical protein
VSQSGKKVLGVGGAVGRADGASILAGIQIDAPSRTVSVYLTDLAQENDFRAAMRSPIFLARHSIFAFDVELPQRTRERTEHCRLCAVQSGPLVCFVKKE